ncbi:hypothetical protein HID58_067122 [Brassica napus]|uniref:Uncharacterized protein n=1 Tax=Brassica napus TaxID=3708 RepID=A0ABQ7ZI02_BRANA|nr:hypothetical protein HID58_067122 [Brassica napus]
MLLPSSPPPSTLSAFVGLLKFVVGCLLSYWDPHVVGQKRFLLGTDLKNASTTTRLMTASSNKTPDVDSQSILPAATVSYTVHVPKRAEEVDEAMPSFENEEKRHVSDCFKFIKPSSPLSLCVNEITIFVCFFLLSTLVIFNYLQTISHQEKSCLLHDIDVKQCNKETN